MDKPGTPESKPKKVKNAKKAKKTVEVEVATVDAASTKPTKSNCSVAKCRRKVASAKILKSLGLPESEMLCKAHAEEAASKTKSESKTELATPAAIPSVSPAPEPPVQTDEMREFIKSKLDEIRALADEHKTSYDEEFKIFMLSFFKQVADNLDALNEKLLPSPSNP